VKLQHSGQDSPIEPQCQIVMAGLDPATHAVVLAAY
jgi:hypothetical protein